MTITVQIAVDFHCTACGARPGEPCRTAAGRSVPPHPERREALAAYERMGRAPDIGDCTCLYSCADDPASACSLSGDWHVHPQDARGVTGPCPLHPDAPGDL
jgi:hypothetical protein